MKALSAAIFVAGVGFVGVIAASGFQFGLIEVSVLSSILAFAGLGIAAVVRSKNVSPATCSNCGGLISPNAPSCKHCGTQLS